MHNDHRESYTLDLDFINRIESQVYFKLYIDNESYT